MIGFGGVRSAAMRVVAIVDLARTDYHLAYQTLKPLVDRPFLHTAPLRHPDFVEAASRIGRSAEAMPFSPTSPNGRRNGSRWALGVAERCRELVSADETPRSTTLPRSCT